MGKRSRIDALLNIEPHYVELRFPCRCKHITVDAVIEAAREHCEHIELPKLFPGTQIQLRYITNPEQAFDRDSGTAEDVAAHLGLTSPLLLRSNIIHGRATVWYREIGHQVVSEALSSSPLPLPDKDTSTVRLYIVIPVVINSQMHRPYFLPLVTELSTVRAEYLKATKHELQHRMSTFDISSPSYNQYGPLPALFCPPFAYTHNMSKGSQPKHPDPSESQDFDVMVWLTLFAQHCCSITDGEKGLGDAIEGLLRQLIDDEGLNRRSTYVDEVGTAFEMDFSAECLTAHRLAARYIAIELKVMTMTGGDPVTQALLAFKLHLALPKNTNLLAMSCCPCLIMSIAGHQLTVVLAYFTDCVYATELFTMSLKGSCDNFWLLDRAPSILLVRETAKRLREWYATIHTGSIPPQLPHLFPQPQSIFPLLKPDSHEALDAIKSLRLVFIDKVIFSEKSPRCLYRGVTIGSRGHQSKVYIKFVDCVRTSYGEEQHRLLASHGFAPQLYLYCEIVRGTVMVVMEDLETSSLVLGYPRKYIPTLRHDVAAALTILEEKSFVHGDVRPENVVLKWDQDGVSRAYLVDFDWAGVADKATYPAMLNPDIDWPLPVHEMQNKPIRKDHDWIMFRKLVGDDDNDNPAKRLREEDNYDMAEKDDRQVSKKLKEVGSSGPPGTDSSAISSSLLDEDECSWFSDV